MIILDNIYKSFNGQRVLDGLSLRVNKGETLAIVGPSGTGKSVTLKHMLGLLVPDSGEVLVEGEKMICTTGGQCAHLRDKFGVLFQSGALINWLSVGDNISLPLIEKTKMKDDQIAARVSEVLSMVEMDGAEFKMPAEISGGMKKRAGLARAIVLEPSILLYDEPTSGLDPVLSRKIDRLIKNLSDTLGVTSVVVTHDLVSAFSIADRIVMLHGGKVIEEGTPEEFRQSKNPAVVEFIDAQFNYDK